MDPKGVPFKSIRGPKDKHAKIGVVGAGPSGVHMAYSLKKRGFHHVTILEKSNRIGGKSNTMRVRGTNQGLTTLFFGVNQYNSTMIPLFKKFGLLNATSYQVSTRSEDVMWNTNDENVSPSCLCHIYVPIWKEAHFRGDM